MEILGTYPGLLNLWDVEIQSFVDLLQVQYLSVLNTVKVLSTTHTHFVFAEVPIKQNSGRNYPLVVMVTVEAVVLSIVLA